MMDGIAEIVASEPVFSEPRHYNWTTREIALVQQSYERLGPNGMADLLPGRTPGSIYQQAKRLGLKAPRGTLGKGKYNSWPSNPHIDEAIRRLYQSLPEKGKIKAFAASIGRPRCWVTQRAQKLGVVTPRFKEPQWMAAELEMLDANAHKSAKVISGILKRHGFSRTATAITVKLKRIGACRIDPDHYTANGLAELFGVDRKVVTGWIAKGWLKAKRRGTDRIEAQGSDEWWIHRRAVRTFIVESVSVVDIRKVDKVWFVELLAGAGDKP